MEYIDSYRKAGKIANSAGEGRCAYTTRPELAVAYARTLLKSKHNGRTYNLHGALLTQTQLKDYINRAYGIELRYRSMSHDKFQADRIAEIGDFIGSVIDGIYQGIHDGALDNASDFETAAGRPHQSWDNYFQHAHTTIVCQSSEDLSQQPG